MEVAAQDPSLPDGARVLAINGRPVDTAASSTGTIGPEPTFIDRAKAAVAPTIRGMGDITGANAILEQSGLVQEGRLTGPEQNAQDTATRHTAAVGGGAMAIGQSVDAILSAATTKGMGVAARAIATARAAGHEMTPIVKYEIARTALTGIGVPSWAAMGAAAMISGYRGNGKTVRPTEAVPPSAEGYDRYMPNTSAASPSAVASAPPETVAAPSNTPAPIDRPAPAAPAESPRVAAQKFSPQKALNELAIQARRQGTTLTAEETQAAVGVMQAHGVSAADAVKTLATMKGIPTSLTLSPEEATQYLALRSAGKSGGQAEAAILQLRQLAKGLPTTAEVQDSVPGQHARGVTGKWKADQ